jgi:oxygen-independent coproporphyrinogen-3 oxidase
MLGMRLSQGTISNAIESELGSDRVNKLLKCLQHYIRQGWVEISDGARILRLTDPEGLLFSNTVLAEIFSLEID